MLIFHYRITESKKKHTFFPMDSVFNRKFFACSSAVTMASSKIVKELIPESNMFLAISDPKALIPIKRTLAALNLLKK